MYGSGGHLGCVTIRYPEQTFVLLPHGSSIHHGVLVDLSVSMMMH